MIFTELVLENFGPYAGRHTINLRPEIYENSRPIILFGGMNGGGKTTLMDAIRLALYGSRAQCSTRGNLAYNDFLTQAVNHQASPIDKARIELAFEHIYNGEWKELRLVRYWERNPKEGKDHLGIIDGEYPDTALASVWDEYIETLLPLGISNLFLFDGEQVKELAEQDIPPQTVIDGIQVLLGLELAEKLAMDLDILVTRKRKTLATASQLATMEAIEGKISCYQEEEGETRKALKGLQNQLKFAQENFNETANKFRLEGGKLAANKNQLESKKRELTEATGIQRQDLQELAANSLPLKLILPLLQEAKSEGEKELKIQRARVARDILLERDDRLLSYLDRLSLEVIQLDKIKTFLDQENQTLNQEISASATCFLDIEIEDLKRLEAFIDHQLPRQIEIAKNKIKNLKTLELDLDNTEGKLAITASPEAYKKLDYDLQKSQKELLKAQTNYDATNRRLIELQNDIEKARKELTSYSKNAIDNQTNEYLIQSASIVQQTLELFKERLTLKKLNKLESEVTECFRYLLHKSDLVYRVAIESKNFSLSLYNSEGQVVPKHRLSAGEKQLLSIAFLWGLARISGHQLPVAIDTPLGRLDSSHRNNLVERYFPTASHQVILLSTDTEIGEKEVQQLREQDVIAHQYLLKYNPKKRQTDIQPGYFC